MCSCIHLGEMNTHSIRYHEEWYRGPSAASFRGSVTHIHVFFVVIIPIHFGLSQVTHPLLHRALLCFRGHCFCWSLLLLLLLLAVIALLFFIIIPCHLLCQGEWKNKLLQRKSTSSKQGQHLSGSALACVLTLTSLSLSDFLSRSFSLSLLLFFLLVDRSLSSLLLSLSLSFFFSFLCLGRMRVKMCL